MSNGAGAVVIWNKDKAHIGFTLFVPDFYSSSGKCVFMIMPRDTALFDSLEVITLQRIQDNREHNWSRSTNEVVVSFEGEGVLKYSEDGSLLHIPSNMVLGTWFVPEKNNLD